MMDKASILVVEDENIVALDIQKCLRNMGYTVAGRASSGEEAIHKAAEVHPDLVLVDIKLKGEMDGVEAAEQIRTQLGIPVVYLTAYADEDTLQRVKITEPFGYVTKPFHEKDLVVTIEMALTHHKMNRELRESEERYRQLVEHAPTGLYEIDLSRGQLTAVNDVLCEYTGYTREEFLSLRPFDLLAEDSKGQFSERLVKILAGEQVPETVEYQISTKDGRQLWVILNARFRYARDGSVTATVVVHNISERKRAEEALRQSEEKYRRVVENANEAIVVAQDGVLKYTNPKTSEIIGYSSEELALKPFTELIHPDDRQIVLGRYYQRLQGEHPDEVYTFRIVDKEGNVKAAEIRAVLVEWDGGPATLNFLTDITERHQAEEALRESEERFRSMVQYLTDIVWVIDRHTRFTYETPSCFQVLGYEPGLLLGRAGLEFVHPDDVDGVVADLGRVLSDANDFSPTEFRFRHADGHWVYLEAVGNNMLEHPAIQGVVITARDVSDRKRDQQLLQALNRASLAMEKALTQEEIIHAVEQEFEKLGFSCMVLLTDDNQDRLSIRLACFDASMMRGAEKLVGQKLEAFAFPVEDAGAYKEVVWAKRTVFMEGETAMRQVLPARAKGVAQQMVRELKMQWAIAAPLIVDDRVIGVLSVHSDELGESTVPAITAFAHQVAAAWHKARLMQDLSQSLEELKRTQTQLVQAHKMEAIGRLAGGVAHDFDNLLTVIQVNTEMLAKRLHPVDPLWESVQQIQKAGERASRLTRQLLSFSRREAIEPRVIDLGKLVADLSNMLKRIIGEDIELVTSQDSGLWAVRADPSQMEQVIINLAANARDAMPEGGRLYIDTTNVVLDEPIFLRHSQARQGEYVLLAVTDTGMGMDDELQVHIFEPFFTTSSLDK